jgi:DNA-binding response OmpR family regulator
MASSTPTERLSGKPKRRLAVDRRRCALLCRVPRSLADLILPGLGAMDLKAILTETSEGLRDALFDEEVALVVVYFGRDLAQGAATCSSVRRHSAGGRVPVVALVEEAALNQFPIECGADDVMVIPFSAGEAALRVRLALWGEGLAGGQTATKIGDLLVDPTSMTVRLKGAVVDLTYKEFSLLQYLLANAGNALTRDQILAAVWGDDYFGGDRTVDIHVRRLRAKLPPLQTHIATVHGVGYRFTLEEVAE